MHGSVPQVDSVSPPSRDCRRVAAILKRAGFIRITDLCFRYPRSLFPLVIKLNTQSVELGSWGIENGIVGVCTSGGDIWVKILPPCGHQNGHKKGDDLRFWKEIFVSRFLKKIGVHSWGGFNDTMTFVSEAVGYITSQDLEARRKHPFHLCQNPGNAYNALNWFRHHRRFLETPQDSEDN